MSIHPSLRSKEKGKKQKTVLKRTERLKVMMEKGQWKEGEDIYGLPKIKTIRIKIKKEKTAEKTAETAETAAAATPETAAKPQAGAAPKATEKK